MKCKLIASLALAAFFSLTSIGLCAGLKPGVDIGEWMTFYYQHPDPENVPAAMFSFCESPMYKSDPMLGAAFFSALFKKDPELMQKTYEEIGSKGSDDAKIIMLNSLSFTRNSGSKVLLEKARDDWKSNRVQGIISRIKSPQDDLYDMAVDTPGILDLLWVSFFATGDALPVQRIISALTELEDGHQAGNLNDMLVGGAANWSLRANAKQHPRVMEICKQELQKAKGKTKEILEEIVK